MHPTESIKRRESVSLDADLYHQEIKITSTTSAVSERVGIIMLFFFLMPPFYILW